MSKTVLSMFSSRSFIVSSLTCRSLIHFHLFCMCGLSHSLVSDPLQPYGLQPTRLLCSQDFFKQEYWSGLPFPLPRNLPDPGIVSISLVPPALQADYFYHCPHSCDIYPIFPAPFVGCFTNIWQSCLLCHRIINHKCLVYFWTLYFCPIDLYACFCASTTLFITLALQYNLKSGNMIPLALFFFLKIVLAIWVDCLPIVDLFNFLLIREQSE